MSSFLAQEYIDDLLDLQKEIDEIHKVLYNYNKETYHESDFEDMVGQEIFDRHGGVLFALADARNKMLKLAAEVIKDMT